MSEGIELPKSYPSKPIPPGTPHRIFHDTCGNEITSVCSYFFTPIMGPDGRPIGVAGPIIILPLRCPLCNGYMVYDPPESKVIRATGPVDTAALKRGPNA